MHLLDQIEAILEFPKLNIWNEFPTFNSNYLCTEFVYCQFFKNKKKFNRIAAHWKNKHATFVSFEEKEKNDSSKKTVSDCTNQSLDQSGSKFEKKEENEFENGSQIQYVSRKRRFNSEVL